MVIHEGTPLKELTTLRTGGPARYVIACETDADVRSALEFANERSLKHYILGDGSNVLASDAGFPGVIILPRMKGMAYEDEGANVSATIGAGESWDAFVREAAARNVWGIENLAGIPGLVGACPVQNIGAYGVEVGATILFVEAIEEATGSLRRFTNEECEFGYRDSLFKREGGYVIVRVGFRLAKSGTPLLSYADLARAQQAGADCSTPALIGEAVRQIRARKFPDLQEFGTAGSFFKNPVVDSRTFEALKRSYPDLGGFPAEGGVKIPLAYILDRVLSLKGFRIGSAWLYDAQPLVLVLDENGKSEDVDALAGEVFVRVKQATGISIEREVRALG